MNNFPFYLTWRLKLSSLCRKCANAIRKRRKKNSIWLNYGSICGAPFMWCWFHSSCRISFDIRKSINKNYCWNEAKIHLIFFVGLSVGIFFCIVSFWTQVLFFVSYSNASSKLIKFSLRPKGVNAETLWNYTVK